MDTDIGLLNTSNNSYNIFNPEDITNKHNYPVSFLKETASILTNRNLSDTYIFKAGSNNKFYIDIHYFNFYNKRDTISKDIEVIIFYLLNVQIQLRILMKIQFGLFQNLNGCIKKI